jgi:hypothetical protein
VDGSRDDMGNVMKTKEAGEEEEGNGKGSKSNGDGKESGDG